jgi:hypothetical protein
MLMRRVQQPDFVAFDTAMTRYLEDLGRTFAHVERSQQLIKEIRELLDRCDRQEVFTLALPPSG